jgi:putative NADH-flavin reductase
MKVVIFGASGRTGQPLVQQALEQGHQVVAFVRNPASLGIKHDNLTFVQGDVLDPKKVEEAVAGADAVFNTLGQPNEPNTTVLSEGTRNIIQGMQKCGVRRLISQASLGTVGDDKEVGIFFRWIVVPIFLKHKIADKQKQDQYIRESNLDWTVVRATQLTSGPKTGKYRSGLNLKLPWWAKIAREDVADFMLKQLTDKTYVHQSPGICY